MIFSFSGSLRLFLVCPCCVCICNPLRVSSWPSTLILSLRVKHQRLSLCIQPQLFVVVVSMWATFWLGSATWHDLGGEFSVLPLSFHCFSAFWGLETLPCPACEEFLSVQKLFLQDSLTRLQVPILKSFVSIFVFSFCLTSFRGDWFAFLEGWGPLPVFTRYSMGVVPHADYFFFIFVGGEVISPSYSSTNLNLHPPKSVLFKWKLKYGSFFFFLFIFSIQIYCHHSLKLLRNSYI